MPVTMESWNIELRALRENRGMSREELARRCGFSADSLRSYELGRRRPTRARLIDLLKCLEAGERERNAIVAGAGLLPEAPIDRFREPNVPLKEAIALIRRRPLPAFLLNERAEVLAVSEAAWRLLGMRERGQRPRRRSALSGIAFHLAASRLVNWDEMMRELIQIFKAGLAGDPSIDVAGPPISTTVKKLAADDPARWARFVALWEKTPPFRGRMTGHMYNCVWRGEGGTIRLTCFIGCLNTEVGLYAHTMVPADAKSHRLLERLIAD